MSNNNICFYKEDKNTGAVTCKDYEIAWLYAYRGMCSN